jgi:hypothetical protein
MVMERAQVFQQVVLSPEVTPGDRVAPAKRLMSTSIEITPNEPIDMVGGVGSRFDHAASPQKGMSDFRYEGRLNFNDMCYILSSLLGVSTGTWAWKPSAFVADALKTYSMRVGGAAGAEEILYSVFNSLRIRANKTDVAVSGDGFGMTVDESPALGSVTIVPKVIAVPTKVSYFIGDSVGGLTRLTRLFEAEFSVGKMYGPVFTGNEDDTSYSDIVCLKPELGFTVTLAHDSVSKALMTNMRAQDQKFFRMLINGRDGESMQITSPVFIREPKPGENQGVHGRTYNLGCDFETAFDGGLEVLITNALGSL